MTIIQLHIKARDPNCRIPDCRASMRDLWASLPQMKNWFFWWPWNWPREERIDRDPKRRKVQLWRLFRKKIHCCHWSWERRSTLAAFLTVRVVPPDSTYQTPTYDQRRRGLFPAAIDKSKQLYLLWLTLIRGSLTHRVQWTKLQVHEGVHSQSQRDTK